MRFFSKTNLWIGSSAALVVILALSIFLVREWDVYKERYFVREVLLYSEFGDRVDRVIRWAHSPRIVFASEREGDQEIFNDVVSELSNALDGTGYSLITEFDKGLKPNIFVFISESSRFLKILELMDCLDVAKLPGFFCTLIEHDWSLKKGVVVISPDISLRETPSLLLEKMFQVLGPANDSDVYPDSLVFETGTSRTTGKTLSARDKKLLRFLYMHLKPGDGEEEVRQAFDKYWDKMD